MFSIRSKALLAAVSLAVLAACGAPESDSGSSAAGELPSDVEAAGKIVVALNPTLKPISWVESNNELQGLAADIALALGDELGVEVELQPMSLDGMIPGLQSRKVDVALLTDSEERQQSVDFVDYLTFHQTFVTLIDSPLNPETAEDLCGLSVASNRGSSTIAELDALSTECTKNGEEEVRVDVYDSQAASAIAIKSGRTDVYLTTSLNALELAKEGDIKASGEINPSYAGFVFAKDRPELRDAVQAAMEKLDENGTLTELFEKWELSTTYMVPEINTATDE